MQNTHCPNCGGTTDTNKASCPCELAARNGSVVELPPEVATWIIEPVPPEVREHFIRTFDEAEYWAELRETEKTGGVNIDELVRELERKAHGGS